MWTPNKYEAKRAKQLLQVAQLDQYEKKVINDIVHAHQISAVLEWSDIAMLMALEEKYKELLK